MKPIQLTVRVHNNRMLTMRKALGLSQKELGRLARVDINQVCALESLRKWKFSNKPPVRVKQEQALFEIKRKISDFFEVPLKEMFPDELDLVISNRVIRQIDVPEALQLKANSDRLLLAQSEQSAFDTDRIDREKVVEASMASLSDRERAILRMRFGLDDGTPKTLEEVGKMFKINRERVRQIESKCIRKLRHPSQSRKLREYA